MSEDEKNLTNTETEISDTDNDGTDVETSSARSEKANSNPYADDLIMFQNNARPPSEYIKLIKKLFDEVAPKASQEQKDLLKKLTTAIVKANIHAVNECREKYGEEMQEAREDMLKSEEQFELFQAELVRTENQVNYFSGLARKLEEENREGLETCRGVQKEHDDAKVARTTMLNDMNKERMDYDKKFNEAQQAHEVKVKALKEEIQKLRKEKMTN